jgi:predicted Fe-Mo cluster-binding NifX family protein
MRMAIALNGTVCAQHFGESHRLALVEIDETTGQVRREEVLDMPEHTPGAFPRFITQHDVDLVFAGGIGERAIIMLAEQGIRTIAGAPPLEPTELARRWLAGELQTETNLCGHGLADGAGPHHHDHHHHGCENDPHHHDRKA